VGVRRRMGGSDLVLDLDGDSVDWARGSVFEPTTVWMGGGAGLTFTVAPPWLVCEQLM